MYKLAVVGDAESVGVFSALGAEVYRVQSSKEAEKIVKKLAKDDFAVIFIPAKIFSDIGETVAEFDNYVLPSVVPIPTLSENTGVGIKRLRKTVERAIGADIFQDEKR